MERIEIIDANADNICEYGLCGYKDTKREGYRRKLEWLSQRFHDGLKCKIIRAEDHGSAGFIEFIPGEYCWRPVEAPGYMFIHCVMMHRKKFKGKGYGALLLEQCIQDAKRAKMNGIAVVASEGTWMAGRDLFIKNGFRSVDVAPPSFTLLAKTLRKATLPRFKGDWKKKLRKYGSGLTIIQSDQCPCIAKCTQDIIASAEEYAIHPKIIELKSCGEAQDAPSAYGIFNIVFNNELIADHPIGQRRFINIMNKMIPSL